MAVARSKSELNDRQKTAKHEYSVHQDQLFWSRVQTLIAIQTATLAGTYYLVGVGADALAASLLTALGLILTALLWIVAERDQLHREQSRLDSEVPKTEINPDFPLNLEGGKVIRGVILLLALSDIIVWLRLWGDRYVIPAIPLGLILAAFAWWWANSLVAKESEKLQLPDTSGKSENEPAG